MRAQRMRMVASEYACWLRAGVPSTHAAATAADAAATAHWVRQRVEQRVARAFRRRE